MSLIQSLFNALQPVDCADKKKKPLELWVLLGLKDHVDLLTLMGLVDLLALMGIVDPQGLKGPTDHKVQMDLGGPWVLMSIQNPFNKLTLY
ncbi:hypothetical protein L0F63_002445 [Massospora cicadina]|nr:hypothetical protein L0F63_002445 [Massospora cicadina]